VLYTIQYQDILDRSDYSQPPVEQNIYPMDGDQRLREIQIVTRHDIDNTNELIRLLETSRVPLVQGANGADQRGRGHLHPGSGSH
ncbi:MAG: hypothetical protein H6Q31_3390, partial [Bacteroidetes bacterium]|nr:hypothetical protein [Bacteroidota bacterium]